jgi:ribonucleoside-diphosphate reductase alpha chain
MNCLDGTPMEPFINKHLKTALEECGCGPEVFEAVVQSGSVQAVEQVPEVIRNVFRTSLDISAADHLKMQAVIQEFCCNAISKTINFSKSATVEDVRNVFITGWKLGLKGMTVYRNGSREMQVLVTNDEPVETSKSACKDGTCDL